MLLEDFKTNFRFNPEHTCLGLSKDQLAIIKLPSYKLIKNPKLFILSCSASFNGKLEPMVFISDLLTSDISLAIDLVYEKLEDRLNDIKTELAVARAKDNSRQLFVEARVSFTIKQATE